MNLYSCRKTGLWPQHSYPVFDLRPYRRCYQPNLFLGKLFSMVYGLFKPCCFTHVTGTCFKETALFFNVHLSCFVDFILCPTDKYMFKVSNRKIRLICMYSSFKINTACHLSFAFIDDFDHSQNINIVFLLLALNKYLPFRV